MIRRWLKLLPIYELTIAFNQSNDYRKLVVLIHVMALLALFQSTCPMLIAFPIALALLIHGYHLFCRAQPTLVHDELVYRAGRWFLHDVAGPVREYTNAIIRFDVALFMRIELVGEGSQHRLIFFHDQLTGEQRRLLYLLQRPPFKSGAPCVKIDACD